ncbi:sensor histidine kinase [Paracoccus sp. SM22M-07]|uniref:sensor histidine kinase n=1 Tax=Paracoccus sp. SM22M-07 TaxID=1520813 RepID=UPI0009168888|nr:PAS domain-containing sensor histidine kinase [Paracoccus sp. SM22M-07]OJH46105.1 histidine kinase [Paracoccus sp. SM22M-07]
MGRAIRDFDWSQTPLGPIEQWSAALLSAVRILLGQRHAACMFWGPELTMLYNDGYAPALGQKECRALGQPFRVIWADVWDDVAPLVDMALSGRGTYNEELRLVMTRNGFDEETFWTFSYSPLYDDDGSIAGLINITVDVTEVVQGRRNQQIMQQELLHRIKNILSVTSTVVSASLRNATSIQQARDTVGARIMALARAQGLFTELGDSAEITDVMARSIGAHLDGGDRIRLSGPAVRLSSQQAVGLSLALYELSTNAAKYGALSVPEGAVDLTWAVQGDAFALDWIESGGAPVRPPEREGFGSKLVNMIVPTYFEGEGDVSFDPAGLHYRLRGQLSA